MTSQPTPVTLHRVRLTSDVEAALDKLDGDALLFVTCPSTFTLARRVDGHIVTAHDTAWQLPSTCFQLTAFTEAAELRWLAHPDGGRTVYLAEDPDALPDGDHEHENCAGSLDQRSLLWGTPTDGTSVNGFSPWRAGRIGGAWYPVRPGTSPERVVLRYREYVRAGAYGTLAVADTRLLSLRVTS